MSPEISRVDITRDAPRDHLFKLAVARKLWRPGYTLVDTKNLRVAANLALSTRS
jgi:hypothetical protein